VTVYWEVQFAFFLVVLLFTFSRSECPCPKAFTGPNAWHHGSEPRASGARLPHFRRLDGPSSSAEHPHHPRMELPDALTGHCAYWQADHNPSPSRSSLARSRNLPSHFMYPISQAKAPCGRVLVAHQLIADYLASAEGAALSIPKRPKASC
jgi:hypothetical protein